MVLLRLSIVLLITVHVCSVVSQSDPACTTPTKKAGFCVPIERCRNIYNLVKSPTPPPIGNLNYIKRAECKLPDVMRSVCCQVVEVKPAPTITNLLPTTGCGDKSDYRISGGNVTFPFQYPWMVLLRYLRNGELVDGCGGSLINNRYVLTAAHCVQTANGTKLSKVRLGEHDKSKVDDCIIYKNGETECADPFIEVDIESTVVHSEYNRPIRFRHDIALIRMARKVVFSDSIKPICLPIREDIRRKTLQEYILTGWGTTEDQEVSNVLLQAVLKHVPVSECQRKIRENRLRINITEEHQMCAGGENLVHSCAGDSGGPLGNTVDLNGTRFVQYGIVSAGANACGQQNVPGIYTRVSSYMNWIVRNIRP